MSERRLRHLPSPDAMRLYRTGRRTWICGTTVSDRQAGVLPGELGFMFKILAT